MSNLKNKIPECNELIRCAKLMYHSEPMFTEHTWPLQNCLISSSVADSPTCNLERKDEYTLRMVKRETSEHRRGTVTRRFEFPRSGRLSRSRVCSVSLLAGLSLKEQREW